MQAEGLGDLAQHERPHGDFAVLEEMPLAVDDRLRNAQDGIEALLHVLDEPARLLQLRRKRSGAARAGRDLGIQAVDPQARHRLGVEARAPHVAHFAHHHVGDHIARLDPGEGGARTRVEAEDQALRRTQGLVVRAGECLQPRVVARGEELQVRRHDLERKLALCAVVVGAQLEREALTRRARADARGLEVLQVLQGDRQLAHERLGIGFRLDGQERRDLFERLREITILVERVDQKADKHAVAGIQLGKRKLRVQVVAQRRRVRLGEGLLAFLVAALARAPVARELARPVGVRGGRRFGRRAARAARRGRGRRVPGLFHILALERRVLHQQAIDLLVELDRGELQQPDRLLQLRRQREVLR